MKLENVALPVAGIQRSRVRSSVRCLLAGADEDALAIVSHPDLVLALARDFPLIVGVARAVRVELSGT